MGVAAVPGQFPAGARRAVRQRVWAWRLLLAGWACLTGLVTAAGLRWLGAVSLCCPLAMVLVLLMLGWCAAADLRAYRRELWDQG